MAKVIYKSQIENLLLALSEEMRVIAPVEKNRHSASGRVVFREYKKGDHLELSYPVTVLPPKEFLLPPTDVLFEYKDGKTETVKPKNTLIFGVSYEDLVGVAYLDKIFSRPIEDEHYKKNRQQVTVVAVDRFSPPKDVEYDLYLQKIASDTYAAFAGSIVGRRLMRSKFFENHRIKIPAVTATEDPILSDKNLPAIIEGSKNHPIWDELTETCFGCGICSYVCPLCYCFETEDTIQLPIEGSPCGKRCRTWDSCMLGHFAEVSGHNFRPELRDRIYNWYYHKFVRMPREYGFVGCVDCNRCVVYCPAGINYRTVILRLKKDFRPGRKK